MQVEYIIFFCFMNPVAIYIIFSGWKKLHFMPEKPSFNQDDKKQWYLVS